MYESRSRTNRFTLYVAKCTRVVSSKCILHANNFCNTIFCMKVSQSKRLKSDIATLEYDLAALKKVGGQQRADLKQIGNLIMSELKSLREKTLQQEESLNRECKISQKFTTDLPVMVTTIKVVGTGLSDLKKEVTSLQTGMK